MLVLKQVHLKVHSKSSSKIKKLVYTNKARFPSSLDLFGSLMHELCAFGFKLNTILKVQEINTSDANSTIDCLYS